MRDLCKFQCGRCKYACTFDAIDKRPVILETSTVADNSFEETGSAYRKAALHIYEFKTPYEVRCYKPEGATCNEGLTIYPRRPLAETHPDIWVEMMADVQAAVPLTTVLQHLHDAERSKKALWNQVDMLLYKRLTGRDYVRES